MRSIRDDRSAIESGSVGSGHTQNGRDHKLQMRFLMLRNSPNTWPDTINLRYPRTNRVLAILLNGRFSLTP